MTKHQQPRPRPARPTGTPTPTRPSRADAPAKAAAAAPSQRVSPITIGLVAVVVAAIAGFAIFFNQQRSTLQTAAPAARPAAVSASDARYPVGVTEEGYVFKGKPDAKVVIEDFSDYQCVHCATFAVNIEPKIDEDFVKTGRVKFVFRDFQFLDRNRDGSPNPNGESHRAAVATYCAHDQGKFWAMHDLLFLKQGKKPNDGAFSDANLEGFAKELGLNVDQFRGCLKDKASEVNGLITRSMGDSKGKQVQGTPTFFVNGRKIESGDYDTLKAAIELAEGAK